MSLRCAAHEVAIYVPPEGSSKLSASDALERCRAFLTDLLGSTPSDVAIYDDRDAELRVTPGAFHDKVEGRTPAFDALATEAGRDELRVVLVAEERALHRLPGGAMAVQRLEDQLQIVEAALALSRRPDPATLTALHEGQGAAWASYLEPLVFRRMKAPRGRPSRVLAPAPLVAAFLERDTIEGWCRIAANAARSALPTRGAQLCAQAARNFETWLRDSVEELPAAGPGGPHGDAESRYRERISEARRAIEEGRWEDALGGAQAAAELGRDLPEEVQGAGTEAKRLKAAALLGRGAFAEAFELLAPALLLEALSGAPWTPADPVRLVVGLPEAEDALRHVAWLCTRTPSLDHPEWLDALDRLQRALDPEAAAALEAARSKV